MNQCSGMKKVTSGHEFSEKKLDVLSVSFKTK